MSSFENETTTTGHQSNSSNDLNPTHDSQARDHWLLCIFTVADVDDRSALLDVWMPAVDSIVKEWRKYLAEPCVASYRSPSLDQMYGSFGHLRRQNANMIALAKRIYLDLCVNLHRIEAVHIIAVESGAYLAKRLIEFIDHHGTQFQHNSGEFDIAWAGFLATHTIDKWNEENSLSPLIRTAVLVHPSLPSPSGIAYSLWSWVKPKVYDHLEWDPSEYKDFPANIRSRSFFVVLLLDNEEDIKTKLLREPKESTEHSKYADNCFKLKDKSGVVKWLIEQMVNVQPPPPYKLDERIGPMVDLAGQSKEPTDCDERITLTDSADKRTEPIGPVDEGRWPKDLTGRVRKTEDHYFAYGGFSQLYKGELKSHVNGEVIRVAIKILTGIHTDPTYLAAVTRHLQRESRIWHSLSHQNIVPFLGMCDGLGPSPAMISPLYDNGDVHYFLIRNPMADRLAIIVGAARGLQYLHSKDIVHGDLKGHNVLIDDDGNPRLCDFGRSRFIDHRGFTTSFAGSARYMAPELTEAEADVDFDDEETEIPESPPNLTKATDVYAFSMVALEILTGKLPFFYSRQDIAVVAQVQDGKRPERAKHAPTTFTDPMWELLTNCWDQNPRLRPDMGAVVQSLESM